MEKPEEQKTYGILTGVEDWALRFFPSKIHPSIRLPKHPVVLKGQWGQRRSLFFVSELFFRYLAVYFERGLGPATLLLTQGNTHTE